MVVSLCISAGVVKQTLSGIITMVATSTKWARGVLQTERDKRGGACEQCHSTKRLEFHHKQSTGLNGRGRGMTVRAKDIRDHPNAYILLCHKCHMVEHNDNTEM